jgi:DNA-binding transcriptional regulator YiaG
MKTKNNHNTALSLDAMRRQFGITLREIADRMNMSVTHVHWVVADPTPTADQVRAVEEAIKAIIRERGL